MLLRCTTIGKKAVARKNAYATMGCMMQNRPCVLVVEDDPAIAEVARAYLAKGGYLSKVVTTIAGAMEELAKGPCPLVMLDLSLPDGSGFEVLDYLQARLRLRETAVVVCTADGAMKTAIDAMRRGAYDYLVKPFNADRLLTTMNNAENTLSLQTMLTMMREEVNRERFGDFIGGSVPMQLVYKMIEAAATSRATVFITGESGTGKEVAARAIHNHSRRASGPFVAVNCAAIPRDLLESELFGHVKGAFTGAVMDRMGAVERALGGTLFLDEICEMPLELQAKLLRFLQGSVYQAVGSNVVKTTNCRIIAATNRDPQAEVAKGNFREDLYYRLFVIPMHLPPLRARREDIMPIALNALRRFAAEENKAFADISHEAQRILTHYDWPGNVRQLLNTIQQIVVLQNGAEITTAMLPPNIRNTPDLGWQPHQIPTVLESEQSGDIAQQVANDSVAEIEPLWRVERRAIENALAHFDGNVQLAAEALQINPSTIYRKRTEWADALDQVPDIARAR
jgi:DNA-binding NtrC family response regulator